MRKKEFLNPEEILSQPFSIERHKLCPYLELEVMIDVEGNVFYAVPSHQEFLIQKACQHNKWTRQQLMDACPPEYYFNFMEWLIDQSGGYIPVWAVAVTDHLVTKKQLATLRKLKIAGLFRGTFPQVKEN